MFVVPHEQETHLEKLLERRLGYLRCYTNFAQIFFDCLPVAKTNFFLIPLWSISLIQEGVPAYTVPQPEEAMSVLRRRASELGVCYI